MVSMEPPVRSDTSATATVIKSPETVIVQLHTNVSKSDGHKIQHSLDTVDELDQKSTEPATISMAQMKKEFRSILVSMSLVKKRLTRNSSSSAYTDSELSSYSSEGSIMLEAVPRLRAIADKMIAAGHLQECIKVYVHRRKIAVDKRFKKLLEIEKMSLKNIRRLEWQVQQEKIRLWMHVAQVSVRGLFAEEWRLTDQVFHGLGTNNIADDCFMKIVKDSVIQLFNFVEAISSRKSPEKLFKILDLYNVISSLMPDIEAIFMSKSSEFIRNQAVETLSSLSEAARGMLSEFEKAVFGETQGPIAEESIHPMTGYVMSYIHDMGEHEQTLNQLIVSNPSTLDHVRSSGLDFDFSEFEGKVSPLVLHLIWIIVVLKFNLQDKSKQYRDASLAHLFLMNNVDYIVRVINESAELREMVGDIYQHKLMSLAEANYKTNYQKPTRSRILDCFRCSDFGKVESFSYGV